MDAEVKVCFLKQRTQNWTHVLPFKELFAQTGQVQTLTFQDERQNLQDPYIRATDSPYTTLITNTCSLNSHKSLTQPEIECERDGFCTFCVNVRFQWLDFCSRCTQRERHDTLSSQKNPMCWQASNTFLAKIPAKLTAKLPILSEICSFRPTLHNLRSQICLFNTPLLPNASPLLPNFHTSMLKPATRRLASNLSTDNLLHPAIPRARHASLRWPASNTELHLK